ncbi:Helix-loop-helix DNA-binding protein [Akanthomyces lecanii RCEF 1005]|uniref:Helix-loop-helix DNA-binding protein n=1 Tax=Akanthomyces lecanii RCEF 1005 TaxID=1081108 RepID=A0A167UZR7_CORDF|nr:Helix-loop-helix DNA-binding protein [Akanthomyces lecanii RCEF 1005]
MDPIQQYVPRRIANNPWENKLPQYQNSQQPHQQLHPDGSLTSPYVSSSTASNSSQMHGNYHIVNCPAQTLVPSNGLAGGSSTSTTPQQAPSTAAGWRQPASHDHGRSTDATNMWSSSSSRWGSHYRRGQEDQAQDATFLRVEPAQKSPVQQSAAAAAKKFKRAKIGDRITHNEVERKYRTNLKDRIAKLRAAVPALQRHNDSDPDCTTSSTAPKVSKGTVLGRAAEYIQQLEQANRAMASERTRLMEHLQILEAMLQNDGVRPPQYTPNHGITLSIPRGY